MFSIRPCSCRDMKFTFAAIVLSALIFSRAMNAEGGLIQEKVSNGPYAFSFVSFHLNMTVFVRSDRYY